MSGLSDYIRDLIKKGYDANSIRATLVSYGYGVDDINRAFSELSSQNTGNKQGFSLSSIPRIYLIAGGILIFIIILVILLLVIFGGDKTVAPTGPSLGFEITLKNNVIRQREALNIDMIITAQSQKRVKISYIISLVGGQPLITKNDSTVVENGKIISKTLSFPELKEGGYTLKVKMEADDASAQNSADFTIGNPSNLVTSPITETENKTEVPVPLPSVKNTTKTVKPKPQKNVSQYIPPNDIPTQDLPLESANINDILAVGKQDKEKAIGMCGEFLDITDKETCYSRLADESKDNNICQKIETPFTRDACYANFALNGDFSVCEKIYDEYQRSICNAILASSSSSASTSESTSSSDSTNSTTSGVNETTSSA